VKHGQAVGGDVEKRPAVVVRCRCGLIDGGLPSGPPSTSRSDGDAEWLDVEEGARYLNMPNRTIRRGIADSEFEAVGSPARIRRDDLDDFIDRSRIKPGELVHLNAYLTVSTDPVRSRSQARAGQTAASGPGIRLRLGCLARTADRLTYSWPPA